MRCKSLRGDSLVRPGSLVSHKADRADRRNIIGAHRWATEYRVSQPWARVCPCQLFSSFSGVFFATMATVETND